MTAHAPRAVWLTLGSLGGNTPQIINDRGQIAMPSAPAR